MSTLKKILLAVAIVLSGAIAVGKIGFDGPPPTCFPCLPTGK